MEEFYLVLSQRMMNVFGYVAYKNFQALADDC
jgi:hypothetical protein